MAVSYAPDVPAMVAPAHLQNVLIGPCTVAYQVQCLLFGIFLQQIISYRDELGSHSRLSKYAVATVLVLNLVYTAICFEDGYVLAAGSDRTVIWLLNGSAIWQALPLLNGVIASTTEAFLTIRAGGFFENRKAKCIFYVWQSCLIILVLFGSFASFAQGLIGYYRPYEVEVIPYNTATSLWLWASAAADCSISLALAYWLNRRIANFNEVTDSVLRKLIMIGMRSAAFTAILSVAGAIMSSLYSGWDPAKANIPIAFWVPTGALYGISLFTTMTSTRSVIEKRLGQVTSGTSPVTGQCIPRNRSTMDSSSGPVGKRMVGHPLQKRKSQVAIPLVVNVHREIVRDIDGVEEEKSSGTSREKIEDESFELDRTSIV
ncbi:DUF6534 domain-containing protein [Sporobolomyces koalae]|uniref:DUF6534 domain-containing protein n=1 Tax=Sporobolomyces koalae TaxID=500713 RepID=UPI00316FA6E1